MNRRSLLPSLWGTSGLRGQDPFRSFQHEMDRLFNDFNRNFSISNYGAEGQEQAGNLLIPNINVSESDQGIEISAELPGVDEKDIDVSVVDNVLTIKGEKKSETEDKTKDYHIVERSYGSFRRSIPLSFEVDAEKVHAKFDKGVLAITLPRPPEVEAKTQKITIQGAG